MFRINPRSSSPIPLQISASFRELIAKGRLKPGDIVPSIAQLSEQFFLNPDQVKLAYKQLIKEGILETRLDGNAIVTQRATTVAGKKLTQVVEGLLQSFDEARSAGIDWGDLEALILWLKEQESKATGRQKIELPEIMKKLYFESSTPASGTPTCPFCREQVIEETIVRCASCKTAYHHECWQETHHCSVFGCSSKASFAV